MNEKLKILKKYLTKNNLKKESDDLDAIIKKSSMFGIGLYLLSLFTGCSGRTSHLAFHVNCSGKSFSALNQNEEVEVLSTLPGVLTVYEASFDQHHTKEQIHEALSILTSQGYVPRNSDFYDGSASEEHVNFNECRKLRIRYYHLKFNTAGEKFTSNSAVFPDKTGGFIAEIEKKNDRDFISHQSNNYPENSWILEDGVFIVPTASASVPVFQDSEKNMFLSVKEVNQRMTDAFDIMKNESKEIPFNSIFQ